MSISNNHYFLKSGIDMEVVSLIKKQLSRFTTEDATIWDDSIGAPGVVKKERISKVCWIDPEVWISGMAAHYINIANKKLFNYDLTEWESPLQYTVYDDCMSHYNWHSDIIPDSKIQRKISISICLSSADEYDGGIFEIMPHLGKRILTYKMDVGDVIIFSSDTLHRVTKVKSGKRISLVGWYGGPNWR